MIKFRCSHCDKKIGVPDKYAGKRVKCPQCAQGVSVPEPELDVPEENNLLLENLLEAPPVQAPPAQAPPPSPPKAAKKGKPKTGKASKSFAEIPRIVIGALLGIGAGTAVWAYLVQRNGFRYVYLSILVALLTTFGIRLTLWSGRRNLKYVCVGMSLLGICAAKLFTAQWVAIPAVVESHEEMLHALPDYSRDNIIEGLIEDQSHFFTVVCRKLEKDGVFLPETSELAKMRREKADVPPAQLENATWALQTAGKYEFDLDIVQKRELVEEIESDAVDKLFNEGNKEYLAQVARLEAIINHPYTYADHLFASLRSWYFDLICIFIAVVCAYCLGAELDMKSKTEHLY